MSTKMYRELAPYWPLMSRPEDYGEEAAFFEPLLLGDAPGERPTLLELGSGGGNNASFLKHRFEATLVDISLEMLDVSRRLNPECEHLLGDMRTLRLGREFDAVFAHDAICYATTADDAREVITTAFLHCKPGGTVVIAPDYVRETFAESTDHGGHNQRDADERSPGLRYLEWVWDPDPDDTSYTVEYAILVRDENGDVRSYHDRHEEGLFGRDQWLGMLEDAGFEAYCTPLVHSEVEPNRHLVFVGRRLPQ